MHLCCSVRLQRRHTPWARGLHQVGQPTGISRRFWRRYHRACGMRLMIGSFWPIALVALAAMGFVCRELARDCASDSPTPRGNRAAVLAGLQSTLPLTL
eukprot:5003666-Prymnesium_polylepis.1